MNIFGIFVIICGITISNALPLNNEQNFRYTRQTAAQALRDNILRQRLKNFPSSPSYQTHVIDYPGSVYSGQSVYVPTNNPIVNHNYQQLPQVPVEPTIPAIQRVPAIQSIPTVAPTSIPFTSTSAPIIVDEPETVEEFVPPVPAVRAPIRRTQRPQQPAAVQRFQGHDFVDEEVLPEQGIQARREETEEERLLREEQAKNAHYSFGTSIDDRINDHSIQRQETRDGLALHGMYSYSDGFFRRTIHYQADENGYRVVKEEIEPIGNGPQFNPKGTADVTANLHNNHLSYSITADDFVREKKNKTVTESTDQIF